MCGVRHFSVDSCEVTRAQPCLVLLCTRQLICSASTGAGNAAAVTRHGSVSRPLALPLNRTASPSAPTLGGAAPAGKPHTASAEIACDVYPSRQLACFDAVDGYHFRPCLTQNLDSAIQCTFWLMPSTTEREFLARAPVVLWGLGRACLVLGCLEAPYLEQGPAP